MPIPRASRASSRPTRPMPNIPSRRPDTPTPSSCVGAQPNQRPGPDQTFALASTSRGGEDQQQCGLGRRHTQNVRRVANCNAALRRAGNVDVIITDAECGYDLHGRRQHCYQGGVEVITWTGQYCVGTRGPVATSVIGTSDRVNRASNSATARASTARGSRRVTRRTGSPMRQYVPGFAGVAAPQWTPRRARQAALARMPSPLTRHQSWQNSHIPADTKVLHTHF